MKLIMNSERYIAYAKEQGHSPQEQYIIDKQSLYKYTHWIKSKLFIMKRDYSECFNGNSLLITKQSFFTELLINGDLKHARGIRDYTDPEGLKMIKRVRRQFK